MFGRGLTLLAVCALPASAFAAAVDDGAAADATAVSELVITGTRLPKADYAADSPIVTVPADAIERRAAVTLDVALNRLPQVVPSFSSAANNPSAYGASYVNLRGLGVSRNLVLLDGRRIVGANASGSVDLNVIPTALIDRVEIITGGASAVYGADAVAGVVNVRLKTGFDGLEASGRYLISHRGDAGEREVTVSGGRRFGDLDVMASVGWARRDEVGKGARSFSSQASGASRWNPSGDWFPGPNAPSQAAVNAVFGSYGAAAGAVTRTGGAGGFSFNADGTLFSTGLPNGQAPDVVNYRGAASDIVSGFYPDLYVYNYQPFNKLILPLERWSGFGSARWQASDRLGLWGQVLYTRYSAATALAPSPAPTDPNPLFPSVGNVFLIPVTNPFIPHDLAVLLASRAGNSPAIPGAGPTEDLQYRFRSVALGPRQSDVVADLANLSGGFRLDLGGDWRAEAFGGWGRYTRTEDQQGLLSVRNFQALLSSPTGGKDLCDGGYNPFGPNTFSAACKSFLRTPARFSTRIELATAQATLTGPIWRLPAGPVLAVFGAEYRHVDYVFTPPPGLSPGEVAGFTPLSPLAGAIGTGDAFVEVNAPLAEGRPLMHRVELIVGYRLSGDPQAGVVHSAKAELGWSFTPALRLRGGVERAVRSPDVFERFEPPTGGDSGLGVDPCAPGALRTPQVLALCTAQATAMGFVPGDLDFLTPGQIEIGSVREGAPSLRPEAARTLTAGLVWQPPDAGPWFRAVQASLDGWDVRIDNAIGYLDPAIAVNACYNVGGGNPTYDAASAACADIDRSGVDFSITQVRTPRVNQARIALSGVDAALTWKTDLAEIAGRPWLGALTTSLQLSWLARFDQQDSPLRPSIDFAGTIADAITGYETLPRWKLNFDLTWATGPFEGSLAGRYIGPMAPRNRLIDPTDTFSTGVGSAWYFDLSARWDVARRARLSAGVLNLFDRGPELYAPNVDAGTEPSTYDVIGRRFWVALTLRL